MFARHVVSQLAAYAEDQLEPARHLEIEAHLAACARCREAFSDIRRGIALASGLQAVAMPGDVAMRIRSQITNQAVLPAKPAVRGWLSAAAAVLVLVGLGTYWQLNRPVRLHAETIETPFERASRRLHDDFKSGHKQVAFNAANEQQLWLWLAAQGAPVTSLVPQQKREERDQFVPIGAIVEDVAGARTSVVSYKIDGRPVTLTVARKIDVPSAPPVGWWSKRVGHRRDAGGVNTLTWSVDGGTYVLVSELDDAGQRACLICHTSAEFRQRLARAGL